MERGGDIFLVICAVLFIYRNMLNDVLDILWVLNFKELRYLFSHTKQLV
jgi:hypothetical protein